MIFTSPNPSDPTPQAAVTEPVPVKTTDIAGNKSVSSDVLHNTAALSHKNGGVAYGVNVLYADGHTTFIVIGGNNHSGTYEPFDPILWADPGPGGTPTAFRIIANAFQP